MMWEGSVEPHGLVGGSTERVQMSVAEEPGTASVHNRTESGRRAGTRSYAPVARGGQSVPGVRGRVSLTGTPREGMWASRWTYWM